MAAGRGSGPEPAGVGRRSGSLLGHCGHNPTSDYPSVTFHDQTRHSNHNVKKENRHEIPHYYFNRGLRLAGKFRCLCSAPGREIRMQVCQMSSPKSNRLRFVFASKVVSFGLSPKATFEDVAVRFDRLTAMQAETPVGIDLTILAKPPSDLVETLPGSMTSNLSC